MAWLASKPGDCFGHRRGQDAGAGEGQRIVGRVAADRSGCGRGGRNLGRESVARIGWTNRNLKPARNQALDDLYRRLSAAAEDYEFEVDFNAGALAIEFETPPGKFVVSPNSPVSQIWVSAHSKSFKLDWDPAREAFVLAGTGQSLAQLIGDAVGQQLGETVAL